MPDATIAAADWHTWASVIPHPKLFQPSGGVSAGLPGAAPAVECAEATRDAVRRQHGGREKAEQSSV